MLRPLSLFRGTLDSCAGAMKYLRAGPILGGRFGGMDVGRGAREDAGYGRARGGRKGGARGGGRGVSCSLTRVDVSVGSG